MLPCFMAVGKPDYDYPAVSSKYLKGRLGPRVSNVFHPTSDKSFGTPFWSRLVGPRVGWTRFWLEHL